MASDTDALQLFHGLMNVIESHVVRDTRSADAWRYNEADFPAFELFVELYCVENLLTRKILRQTRGQPELAKKINNRSALIRPEPGSFHRDRARGDNAKAHCFSMQEFAIIPGTLDRVTDCVAEIQKRTLACSVTFVSADDSGFDLDVALDQPL